MKIITSFFILLIPLLGNAIDFKIGILRNASLKKLSVTVNKANYSLKSADNSLTEIIGPDNLITVNYRSGKISLSIDSKYIGIYDTLKLVNLEKDTGIFEIKSISPNLKSRYYYDDLIIYPQSNSITIVNKIDFEKYIIGVLESEVGLGKSEDFYKVHAIISRTYALKNQYKFIHEGFYLTDLVNCQVYKGNMYKDLTIIDAVKATESLILVDENMDFITASYFSNSGGQTNNVEDVWTKALPYLRSIHDPYSLGGINYDWEKKISKSKWLSYLKNKYQYPVNNTESLNAALNFKQDIRHKYLIDWVYQIPLTEIRKDWKLKSTYFSIYDEGEFLSFKGKGFGHGVGLSQEGAMRMIELGYDFLEVLRFYYTDVHLIDMKRRDFYIID
ncbi:MAG: SpoIID/LytB domain-containing protein [Flavobacteriales bacterium]|nr:SpoIID/LytB domain-containing protein [Flavobacteriales bacterium]